MIPSIDDRLDSIERALREVILPALPADRSMAIEQAHLVLAHIGVIHKQQDRAPAFERCEADEMVALAGDLVAVAAGGDRTAAAAAALRTAIDGAALGTPAGIRETTDRVGAAIETLIDASLRDGDEGFRERSLQLVLDAGNGTAARNRAWNAGCGFEAADSDILKDAV